MALYEFAKDFAGPITTGLASIVAAGVAGTFAYRQWKTASLQAEIALEKLKYDTLKDRIDVMNAARELIVLSIQSGDRNLASGHEMNLCRDRINKSLFYFRREIVIYLNTIIDKCFDASQFVDLPTAAEISTMDSDSRKSLFEDRRNRAEAKRYIMTERNKLAEKFEDDLALDFLRSSHSRPKTDTKRHSPFRKFLTWFTFGVLLGVVFFAGRWTANVFDIGMPIPTKISN